MGFGGADVLGAPRAARLHRDAHSSVAMGKGRLESMSSRTVEQDVADAIAAWMRWIPRWEPPVHRGRARICRRCTGSPLIHAAGIPEATPHQVTHALVSRMQKIIDRRVDEFTEAALPALYAELQGAEAWAAGGYDPRAGLAPEFEGLDPDPEPGDAAQPFLFTMGELAEQARGSAHLPRPPLTREEREQLHKDLAVADRVAGDTGRAVCAALVAYRSEVSAAIARFVEPQVEALLEQLAKHLEPPE